MTHDKDFFIKLGEEAVKIQDNKQTTARERIVPILLGQYHGEPYDQLKAVRDTLQKEGLKRAMILEDAATEKYFDGCNQNKLAYICKALLNTGFFPIPIFYFPKNDVVGEVGLGHHAELVESICMHSVIVDKCAIFKHPDAKVVDHIHLIHQSRRFSVNNFLELQSKVIDYVKGYIPYIEHIIKISEMSAFLPQSLLTQKSFEPKEGGGKNE